MASSDINEVPTKTFTSGSSDVFDVCKIMTSWAGKGQVDPHGNGEKNKWLWCSGIALGSAVAGPRDPRFDSHIFLSQYCHIFMRFVKTWPWGIRTSVSFPRSFLRKRRRPNQLDHRASVKVIQKKKQFDDWGWTGPQDV